MALLFFSQPALAGLGLIRDAETEALLNSYLAPLLKSAGMPTDSVRIILVNDPSLNAFVAGGTNIFINTGLLMESPSPAMVRGVFAHELGHITGGHLLKLQDEMQNALAKQMITTLLSVVAGAMGSGDAAQAILVGGSQLNQYQFFSYSRTQEQAADQAGISLLHQTGASAEGLLDVLELLRSRERLSHQGGVPYLRSHPLTQERIAFVRHETMQNPSTTAEAEAAAAAHRMMLAKLKGFLLPYKQVLMEYGGKKTPEASYAMAVAHYRKSELPEALKLLDGLKQSQPDNPYLHELYGQMLYENGNIAAAETHYEKAHNLLPDAPLISIAYARTLHEKTGKEEAAIKLLLRSVEKEPFQMEAWQMLARLYEKRSESALANWAKAETAFLRRDLETASRLASQAKTSLPSSHPARLRILDLESEIERQKKLKKPA